MDLPDQSMHSPGEGCLKEDKSEIMVSCCHRDRMEDPLAAYPNNSIISHLLRKTIHNKRAMSGNMFYLPTSTALSGLEDQSILCSKDSVEHTELFQHHNPPIGTGMETERPLSDHLQAKRARVENIIRGMASGSPNSRLQGDDDVAGDPDLEQERKEISKENKRKQRLPQHQEHSLSEEPSLSNRGSVSASKNQECHKLKQQLQSMQKLLQQLEEKFFQVYNQHDSQNSIAEEEEEEEEEEEDSDILHPDQRCGLTRTKTGSEATDVPSAVAGGCENRPDWMTSQRREKALPDVNCLGSKGDVKNLQETLKFELSRAVNESIDTVFQKLSSTLLSQSSPPPSMCHPSTPDHAGSAKRPHMPCSPLEPSNTEDATVKPRPLQYYKSSTPQSPEHQTEALSLVVRKSPNSPLNSTSQSVKQPYAFHQPPFQFGYPTMHDSQILEHLLKYGPHGNLGGLTCLPPSLDRASPDSEDLPWESLSMRSKVMSSHLGQHSRPGILGSVSVDGLCLPHVKMECRDLQTMAERSSYISLSIQEGLTPSHLKKAKLMFFYTRYPSSSVLKTYFPDVKFNRCITSQLIKWFSNFREFYYIQMEKVARQAIVDGVNDVKGLTVTRDCELFRALNMHYNKANDFQVPDRFLEVAEITLQEFFTAILLAKDSDPSWKKAIYKVICKLDSDVPEEFKTSTYL